MGLYNRLLSGVILPVGDRFFGMSVLKHLKRYRSMQFASRQEVERVRRARLAGLLAFMSENVPYYQRMGLKVNEADPFETLAQLPVIRKKDIKAEPGAFLSVPKEGLMKAASSGSSGIQGEVYLNREEYSESRALQILWWEWAGFRAGNPILQTGMTPKRTGIKRMKDILFRTLYITAFGLGPEEALTALEEIRRKPCYHVGGYASSLFVLANTARQAGIDDIKLKSVISWGDKMFPHFREVIEKTFHTRVFDTYGCGEHIFVASQCHHGRYHITDPHVIVEILDSEGRPVEDGKLGYVVVTKLTSYSMPLVRYYLGDLAVKLAEKGKCECGRSWSRMEKIIGRDTDIVRTPGGKYLIVHTFTGIFEFIPEVKQFMVVQHDLDGLEIRYIRDKGFTAAALEKAKSELFHVVNEVFPISFTEVDEIPPTPSGKPQIIQNRLTPQQIGL